MVATRQIAGHADTHDGAVDAQMMGSSLPTETISPVDDCTAQPTTVWFGVPWPGG